MRHAVDTAGLLADGRCPELPADRAGRRQFVLQGAACGLMTLLPLRAARAQDDNRWREALAALTGGAQPRAARGAVQSQGQSHDKRLRAAHAFRLCCASGRLRMRLPVAAKMALSTAGAATAIVGSPTPPQKPPLGTSTDSTRGISASRITG